MGTIEKRLEQHFYTTRLSNPVALSQDNAILGTFAYGSMNYGTWKEGVSDVDSKMIIIPHLDQLIFNKPVIYEHFLDNNEKCLVMDIRHFVNNLKKQNINFTEILFTEYAYFSKSSPLNIAQQEVWKYYIFGDCAETLARYDEAACVKSLCGQALHTIHQNPTDGKKIANAVRLGYFLKRYLQGEYSFKQCLQPSGQTLATILELKYSKSPVDEKISEDLIQQFHLYQSIAETEKLHNHKAWGDAYLDKMVKDLITIDLC